MTAFNGRRGPNMYPNIAHLNAITTDADLGLQQQEEYNLEDDLDLFTNTQFFDFVDMGDVPDDSKPFSPTSALSSNLQSAVLQSDSQSIDFLIDNFQVPDFDVPDLSSGFSNLEQVRGSSSFVPIQPQPYPQQILTPSDTASPTSASSLPQVGDKRKIDAIAGTNNSSTPEDAALAAATEEDKRRRNTAASARFRVKKKQREQAMEKTAKDMTDKVLFLESRVGQLETENKILKDLLTERIGKEVDVTDMQRKLKDDTAGGRSTESRT